MAQPENPHSAIEKHLSIPWYALSKYEGEIYKARAKPLRLEELDKVLKDMAGKDPDRLVWAQLLQETNLSILNSTSTVGIVLDGRAKDAPEGFLGDMIEATRLVNIIRQNGKRVKIVTPHEDLFQGQTDPMVDIIPIPENVQASPAYPWRQELLSYLHEAIGDTPCLFPMNATTPAFIQLRAGGTIQNTDSLQLVREAFRPQSKRPLEPSFWGRFGIHQLQAFQVNAHLLGIEEASQWQEFPQAFLHPTKQAQEVAREVIGIYGCFNSAREDCPPVYLQPGVATNGSKLTTKFYPEDKWQEVITQLAVAPHTAGILTFLEPTDEKQASMTLRLATTAVEAGLRVAKVPMTSVKQRFGWTLGSFVAFLSELSRHNGLIVGCDSMPAGHAGPATNNSVVVLGSYCYDQGFYCPPKRALVVMPSTDAYTSYIEPKEVIAAVQYICKDPNFKNIAPS